MSTQQKEFTQAERAGLILAHWNSDPVNLYNKKNSAFFLVNASQKTGIDFQARHGDDDAWMTIDTIPASSPLWVQSLTQGTQHWLVYLHIENIGPVQLRMVIQSVVGTGNAAIDALSVLISNEITGN